MRIDKESPQRRECFCEKCMNYIGNSEKRVYDGRKYFHLVCYLKELERHLKWFDKMEISGKRWRKEKIELVKKYGEEIIAEAL